MPEAHISPNKRRSRQEDGPTNTPDHDQQGARKRRAFLQTMGQQLRELGNDSTSPQDNGRTAFGTSPTSYPRPASRAGTIATSLPGAQNVDTPESDAAPGEDDQVPLGAAKSASKWLWRSGEVLPEPTARDAQPLLFDDLLDWSQSYFDLWHPAYPFLHAPQVIDYFRHLTQTGLQTLEATVHNIFQRVILRSIMSISIADRRQMETQLKAIPSSLVFHSFSDAISSVNLVLTEESSVISLQALVSVQLFLLSMHRYNAASRLEGLTVRMLFQLGLHRCPDRPPSVPSKESELRKRLFWSIYCIDRQICIRLGTPLGIRTDETDVCFPHDEGHREANGDLGGLDARLSLLEFLARHAKIRGSIMENRNKSAMGANYNEADSVMEVEAEHTKWWNIVDEYLSNDESAQSIIKAHQVTLIVVRFESILALHRSILATSKKNSAYNAALQRCVSASRSIINTLHKAIKGFGAFDGSPGQHGYERTPLIWPSFTWAVWMSVFIIVFAATENQVSKDTALRLADRSIEIFQHLALRGTNWPEACSVAVTNLTTRLREASTRSSTAAPGTSSDITPSRASSMYPGWEDSSQRHHSIARSRQNTRGAVQLSSDRPTAQGPSMLPPSSSAFGDVSGTTPQISGSANSANFAHSFMPNANPVDSLNPVSSYFAGAGNFLGIAQQSSDNPIPNDEIMHLFNGEDMAYWFGGDSNFGNAMSFQGNFH